MTFPTHGFDPRLVEASLAVLLVGREGEEVRGRDLIAVLQRAGLRVFIVGGALRDWLSGQPSDDIDLAIDQELAMAHGALRAAFPSIDPVLLHLERFGMLRWGEESLSHVDINILRSYRDIENADMWRTTFPSRTDLVEDAATRDFSINAFYYDCRSGEVLDPLSCGLDDLRQRRLRLIAHPSVLESSFRMSLRIVQFLGRGYEPTIETVDYLRRKADRDVQGMGLARLRSWLTTRAAEGKIVVEDFCPRLLAWARSSESRRLIEQVVDEMRT